MEKRPEEILITILVSAFLGIAFLVSYEVDVKEYFNETPWMGYLITYSFILIILGIFFLFLAMTFENKVGKKIFKILGYISTFGFVLTILTHFLNSLQLFFVGNHHFAKGGTGWFIGLIETFHAIFFQDSTWILFDALLLFTIILLAVQIIISLKNSNI